MRADGIDIASTIVHLTTVYKGMRMKKKKGPQMVDRIDFIQLSFVPVQTTLDGDPVFVYPVLHVHAHP